MSKRKIVKIDEEKCNGCGECIVNCAEGALQIIDGKARLLSESYCDGLGACLGTCPQDAIIVEEREAEAFDEEAVQEHLAEADKPKAIKSPAVVCPGLRVSQMSPSPTGRPTSEQTPSQLSHWPVQLTLVPPDAPFLQGANLLLVADCVPFALADFHSRFLAGHSIVIGCPKLDDPASYVQKLSAIIEQSSIQSLKIIHMEVPCCTGLCGIVEAALKASSRSIPVKAITVSLRGEVIAEQQW